jgi:hypothetical protein
MKTEHMKRKTRSKQNLAYIATDPATGDTFAFCSASPEHLADLAETLSKWAAIQARVELVAAREARQRLLAAPPREVQLSLF